MNRVQVQLAYLMLLLVIGVTACGGNKAGAKEQNNQPLPDPASIGNIENGAEIFTQWHGEAPACSFCHVVEGSSNKTGPSLDGVALEAGYRVEGQDAVEYLRESIIDPNAYIADGKDKSKMYKHFGETFTEAEINDLVAYLLTLQ